MRCPRCGYISFDQIEKCLKCKKDIRKVSDALEGAIPHLTAPEYLVLAEEDPQQSVEQNDNDSAVLDLPIDAVSIDKPMVSLGEVAEEEEKEEIEISGEPVLSLLQQEEEREELLLEEEAEEGEIEIDLNSFASIPSVESIAAEEAAEMAEDGIKGVTEENKEEEEGEIEFSFDDFFAEQKEESSPDSPLLEEKEAVEAEEVMLTLEEADIIDEKGTSVDKGFDFDLDLDGLDLDLEKKDIGSLK